eukprot:COSAG06_NODE_258_length_18940_cov_15.039648_15_plen_94_part_00
MTGALLSPLAALLLATTVRGAGPFGLALSPPMGWRSWNAYGADISQAKLTAGMDAMATKKRLPLTLCLIPRLVKRQRSQICDWNRNQSLNASF